MPVKTMLLSRPIFLVTVPGIANFVYKMKDPSFRTLVEGSDVILDGSTKPTAELERDFLDIVKDESLGLNFIIVADGPRGEKDKEESQ
jgi:hypothetical protein